MVADTALADVSFYFYGTSVQLYGAKRLNHGAYQISIDSVVYPAVNGSVPDPGIFQTPLFTTTELTAGYHTVKMTNAEPRYLDLDFVNCSNCFHCSRYADKAHNFRLHSKLRLDKPMKLSSLELCRIQIRRSNTARNSSGIQTQTTPERSLKDRDSMYNLKL